MTDRGTRREDGQSSALMTLLRAVASSDQQEASRLLDSGRNSTPFTMAKMAAVLPMPIASVATAAQMKPGLPRSARAAWRTSRIQLVTVPSVY